MVSIKSILCPVDFSDFSRHAFARAAALAREHGASVMALHVVSIQPPAFAPHRDAAQPLPLALAHAERERLLGELKRFTASEDSHGVPVDLDVVEGPSVHGEILAQAGRRHADLLVMGTHGRTGFQRLLLGSVTEKILRTARQPVLTVGLFSGIGQTGMQSFRRILCAIDFSECSLAALVYAVSLADGSDAHLTVQNVIQWTPIGYDPLGGPPTDLAGYRMADETTARGRLHRAILEVVRSERDVEEVVTSGKPHHEILRVAAEQRGDLIVLGIHGRNPVDRMLFGSTAEPVVRRAPCPVLTGRAHAALTETASERTRGAVAGPPTFLLIDDNGR